MRDAVRVRAWFVLSFIGPFDNIDFRDVQFCVSRRLARYNGIQSEMSRSARRAIIRRGIVRLFSIDLAPGYANSRSSNAGEPII